ncbi:MAG: HypC/HybG/HupF family hydrogenase formation chaperone [Thermofilaceae archaeon]
MCWGVPAKVVEVEGMEALVDFGGVRRKVLLVVENVKPGSYVVVHAGTAIGVVNPREALDMFKAYRELAASIDPNLLEPIDKAIEELKNSIYPPQSEDEALTPGKSDTYSAPLA